MKLEEAQARVETQERMTEQEIIDFLKGHVQSIDYEDDVCIPVIGKGAHYIQAKGRSGFGRAVHYEIVFHNQRTNSIPRGLYIRFDDERGRNDPLRKGLDRKATKKGFTVVPTKAYGQWLAFPNALDCDQPPSEVMSRIWEGLRKLYDAFEPTLAFFAKPSGARKQPKAKKSDMPCKTPAKMCAMLEPPQPIDSALKNILKDNPFLEPGLLDSWKRELEKLRNRDCAPCDLDIDFVLEDDKEFLKSTAKGKTNPFWNRFRTKLLPQPMVGHPQAPVWILLLNPGFGEKDYYDHVSVSEKMRRCLMVTAPEKYSDKSFDLNELLSEEKLAQRQELMLSSLRCQTWPAPFYILDKAFKTGSAEVDDGWHWWRKRLRLGKGTNSFFPQNFCNNGEEANALGRCLFVLEAFPYHSKTFPQDIVTPWCERKTKYFLFWKRLVQYGLTHKKTIVIRAPGRGRGALGELLDKANIHFEEKDVLFFKNSQQVYFTPENFSDHTPIDNALPR